MSTYAGSPYYYGGGGYKPRRRVPTGPGSNNSPYYYGSGGGRPQRGGPVPVPQPLNPGSGVPGGDTASPASGPSIADLVNRVLDPQLKNAVDLINRRSAMGAAGISGITGTLVGQMKGAVGGVAGAYDPSISAARTNAGFSKQTLTAAGQAAQGDFSAASQQAGGLGPGPSDVNLTQEGAGAGAAAYGTGIAELDRLIANKAASSTRAALEPSFAAGMGQENQYLLAAQLARQSAELQGNIEAQRPGLTLQLQQNADAAAQHNAEFKAQQAADLRDYNERVREWNASQAKSKADIIGPHAPTVQGRQTYWQALADRRTTQEGIVYQGTSTGIRPVIDPKTGKPKLTLQGQASAATAPPKPIKLADGSYGYQDPTTGAITKATGYNPTKTVKPTKPVTGGIYVQKPDGTWYLNPKYRIVDGNPQLIPKGSKQKSGIFGTAPHKNPDGTWTTRKGRKLSPAGQKYYDWLLAQGLIDVGGHVRQPGTGATGANGGGDSGRA